MLQPLQQRPRLQHLLLLGDAGIDEGGEDVDALVRGQASDALQVLLSLEVQLRSTRLEQSKQLFRALGDRVRQRPDLLLLAGVVAKV